MWKLDRKKKKEGKRSAYPNVEGRFTIWYKLAKNTGTKPKMIKNVSI